MNNNNQDYSIFHKFIETYSPIGYNGINPKDALILELEQMMKNNNQFFLIADIIQMKILHTSNTSIEIIGIEPENVTPYYFFDSTHPDDLERHSLGRTQLFKLAQEIFIAKKGNALASTNLKILCKDGKYKCLLFQCYLFYSDTPIKSVYLLQVHSDIDWCIRMKNGFHYYSGIEMLNFRYPDNELLQIGSIYTKREFEIIKLIELGLSSEEIAEKLFVSLNTINAHRSNILKKSGKSRIFELIYELKEQGMI
jgi:DNA-binding CsgD family transcriptional regulator